MIRFLIILALIHLPPAQARVIFQYGLNFESGKDNTSSNSYDTKRTFHKVFLGASVNGAKTFYFGWNVNKWSSSVKQGETNTEDSYSVLEMGPKISWFFNEDLNWYVDAAWNPYAKGERTKAGTSKDISGMSTDFGLGYRAKLSKMFGLGASIHYHSLGLKEEKDGSTSTDVSDKITNLMPMLELTILTR